ncbi:MAG: peroxiredoxin [Novosphingobium sp.]
MQPTPSNTADSGFQATGPCPLHIGDPAPQFSARSTTGPVSLSDFRGRWLILFSHPGDFTPVCTTEFVALARAADDFAERNCALMALSVDSLYAHLAWVRLIRDHYDVEVRFPIVEDPTLVIGRAYDMVSASAHDAAAVRTTFFIDPDGIVRATTCYPVTVGRSVREMLRTLAALQESDAAGALAPEGWQPGDPLLCQPEATLDDAFSTSDALSWFLKEKPND